MQFQIPIHVPEPGNKIFCNNKIMLLGSCFTEHIGGRFSKYGWHTCENPNGIIFNPNSIYQAIKRIVHHTSVAPSELFQHLELWHHWDFHSRFSNVNKDAAVATMNDSIHKAHTFIQSANWIIITLGSSFQYFENQELYGVANCHRVPANQFTKKMLQIDETTENLRAMMQLVKSINPNVQFLFTISPVRHIKDGVVENNVSKARLIEAVYQLCIESDAMYYPAYELMIDVLRDYRYYDVDMVHPNFAATQYVWEYLVDHFFDNTAQHYLQEMIGLIDAYQHKTRFPATQAHQTFLAKQLKKVTDLQEKYPHLDIAYIADHFSKSLQ